MKDLYEEIKKIGAAKGLQVQDLADAVEMTPQGFRKTLKERRAKMHTIEVLTELLGISTSFFFQDGGNKNTVDSDTAVTKMKNEQIARLKKEVESLEIRIGELKEEKSHQRSDMQKNIDLLEQMVQSYKVQLNVKLSQVKMPSITGLDAENKDMGKIQEVANGSNIFKSIVGVNVPVGTA